MPPAALGDLTRYVRVAERIGLRHAAGGQRRGRGKVLLRWQAPVRRVTLMKGRGRIPRTRSLGHWTAADTVRADDRADESGSHRRARDIGMVRVRRQDGTIVEGFVRNEGNQTLPVQTVDGRLYSLEKGSYTHLPSNGPA